MIDVQDLRQKPDVYRGVCSSKNVDPQLVEQILEIDKKRRDLIQRVESLRAEQNRISDQLKTSRNNQLIADATKLKNEIKKIEPELKTMEDEFNQLVLQVPNLVAEDVKVGKDESENEVIKTWGEITQLGFKPKDHLEIGENLDLIDTKRAAKVSGARFGYWKNEAVLMEFGLIQFGLGELTKAGFSPVIPPVIIKEDMMRAMGYLEHGGEEETYHFAKDGLYLVGTSEQSIGPMHSDEVFNRSDLPKKYTGFSTCFRREAGSYGKDTRGVLRVHQFNKMEMFIFALPENSDQEHDRLLALEEKLMQSLNLPYQVVKMCSGDLGAPAARKYDIEVWLPSQDKYRETHSTSTCTDFQARRLNIKYLTKEGTLDYIYTLNGTYFAERILIAILENNQQKDGSVLVPEVLQPYVGSQVITPKS